MALNESDLNNYIPKNEKSTLAKDIPKVKFLAGAALREAGEAISRVPLRKAVAAGTLAVGLVAGPKVVDALQNKPVDPAVSFMHEVEQNPGSYEEVVPAPGDGVERFVDGLNPPDEAAAKELTEQVEAQANADGGLNQQSYIVEKADVDPSIQGAAVTPEDIQQVGQ